MRNLVSAFLCLGLVGCTPDSSGSEGGDETPVDAAEPARTDGGLSGGDAAEPPPGDGATPEAEDMGAPVMDSAMAPEDAAVSPADAAIAPPDATPPQVDAAAPEADAAPSADSGVPPAEIGQVPRSCGAQRAGVPPVDCTAAGDDAAQCVFSDHCLCSEGFECEVQTMWPGTPECDPGSICVPAEVDRGAPTNCGQSGPGGTPLDCTRLGDDGAECVFSDHCMCSEGFRCQEDARPGDEFRECAPGSVCMPDDDFPGAHPWSCGAPGQELEPVDCTAFGDAAAACVFSNHCMCSEGFVCEDEMGRGGECAPGNRCVPQD